MFDQNYYRYFLGNVLIRQIFISMYWSIRRFCIPSSSEGNMREMRIKSFIVPTVLHTALWCLCIEHKLKQSVWAVTAVLLFRYGSFCYTQSIAFCESTCILYLYGNRQGTVHRCLYNWKSIHYHFRHCFWQNSRLRDCLGRSLWKIIAWFTVCDQFYVFSLYPGIVKYASYKVCSRIIYKKTLRRMFAV